MPAPATPALAVLHRVYPFILASVHTVVFICIGLAAVLTIVEVWHWRLHTAVKTVVAIFIAALTAALFWLLLMFSPVMVAKLAFIVCMFVGSLLCWICLANVGRWHRSLIAIEQECDMACHLTFLQGEMARAQLETLSHRIRQAMEPEEREITETMLKSLSPFLMLYLRKEKDLLKWSLAAANMGKDLLKYFWSPRR